MKIELNSIISSDIDRDTLVSIIRITDLDAAEMFDQGSVDDLTIEEILSVSIDRISCDLVTLISIDEVTLSEHKEEVADLLPLVRSGAFDQSNFHHTNAAVFLFDGARDQGGCDPVGEEGDNIADLDGIGTLIYHQGNYAIYRDGRNVHVVADVEGPCMVTVI